MSVNIDQIVVSDKLNHNNNGSRYFIGYQKGEIVKPLSIILPQMGGYIKYFEYGGMNMSFLIKDDDEVHEKYKQIWDLNQNKLGIRFHSLPAHDKKYLKTKVKEYDGVIRTNFLDKDVPKENKRYTRIACIAIDFVVRMDKKNYPQVYLEECKYKIKKKKTEISRFIDTELDSDPESDTESDNDSDHVSNNDSDNDSDNDSE